MVQQIKNFTKKFTLSNYGSGKFKNDIYSDDYNALFEISRESGIPLDELMK